MENTKIEWCDHSWSPWRGCAKVSVGCAHCYAEGLANRFGDSWGGWGKGKPRVLAKNWGDPVKWNLTPWICPVTGAMFERRDAALNRVRHIEPRRTTVFPSLCDWLDEEVPIKWLEKFIELIHKTPNLNWLLLTKRPENFIPRLREVQKHCTVDPLDIVDRIDAWISGDRPHHNVWIGTSVEDQANADRRIPELLKIPARVRFLSVEPMLGPVNLDEWAFVDREIHPDGSETLLKPIIDWVIVGGESGLKARLCNVDWIRSIASQCAASGVPCFVKQLGAEIGFTAPGKIENWDQWHINEGKWISKIEHPKAGDPSEWPEDLRVRQFPEVKS